MATEKDYQTLGVPPGAGPQEIKRAFRRKAKAVHPDVNADEDAGAQFVRVNEAYGRLANDEKQVAAQIQPEYWFLYEMLRPETHQERAFRYAKQWQEDFNRNNAAFKHSSAYLPAKVFAYFLWFLGIALALTFLFGPPMMLFNDVRTGLSMMPITVIGAAFMFGSFRFKREINRYL